MDAIKCEELTKKYKDVTAVDSVNLTVKEGELLALLGVNGAGKTTLIKMLSCLVAPTSGNAYLLSKSIVSESDEVKKLIAVSPQETAVARGLTVRENLNLICGAYGIGKPLREQKILEFAEKLSLKEVMNRKAGKLSGGWQRRLSIAMALIGGPKILFLDEPTLGLDVIARSELWDVIRSLKKDMTVILTTHYMEEAQELADRVAIMSSGRLLTCGTVDEIKQRGNADDFEKAFINVVKEARP